MKELRDKIAEIISEYGLSIADVFAGKEKESILTEETTDQILALLEQCTAMTIEDCPWGKKNVEFREILLRGLNRQLEGIEVEEECDCIPETYQYGNGCNRCHGTGKARRPATLEEIIGWLKLFIPWCEQHPYYEISPDRQALILPSGGRLAVK